MDISIFNILTGEIVDNCFIPEEDIDANIGEGQSYLIGNYPMNEYYVKGGLPVMYPPRSNPQYSYDYDNEQWFDARSSEQIVAQFEGYRRSKLNYVNQTIGQIRSTFVTILPAQDMIYQQKEAEAIAYLNDPASEPDLNNYPFIAAEIGTTAPAANDVAQVYMNLAHQLRVVVAGLEQIRLSAIVAIETASDQVGIDLAVADFDLAIASL